MVQLASPAPYASVTPGLQFGNRHHLHGGAGYRQDRIGKLPVGSAQPERHQERVGYGDQHPGREARAAG